jgi:RNA polymerase sigma-70 factor (ECF subfamily)
MCKLKSNNQIPQIKLLQAREPKAIEEWFNRHVDAVYTFVFYRVGRNADLATDVVQETFLTAIKRIKDYDSKRGEMLVWLTYNARNCIRRTLRQHRRYKSYSDCWEALDQYLLDAYERIATTPLPDEVLEANETAELVRLTLSSIPGNYRNVLQQHYLEQHSLKKIALQEGISEGAVKSLLHRARMAFKTTFLTFSNSIPIELS